ncbi:MAG TPA: glycosyltransferase family 8 protein, partial [Microlunatus sp.]|nr:glycosyltransferase family 8 protein [Microlunatus sp.]
MDSSSNEIKVVVAADAGYLVPLAAMVRSVLDHHRRGRLTVRALVRGTTEADRARLADSWRADPRTRVIVDPIDQVEFGPLVGFNGISVTTYTRLLLADLLPADWSRVIYLDADTIVCSDLRRLWEQPLKGRVIGAVQDDGVRYVSSPKGVREWRELGLSPTLPFFNAGVLLIDLDQWRERGIGRQALNFALDRAGERIVCDQEALNTIVAGEWTPLPDGYNVSALRQALWAGRAAQGMPVPRTHIRHFTTRDKP